MDGSAFREFLKAVLPGMGYRWRRFDRRNIKRRVHRRMEGLGIHELEGYARLVNRDPDEKEVLDALLRLTISRFFRNAWLWADLEALLPSAALHLAGGEQLKVWSAGCAGGEEPFTMAMVLDDLAKTGRLKHPWSILGTDSDTPSLARSREARYGWGSVRETPQRFLSTWFEEEDGLWVLSEEIRGRVTIRQHDVVTMDPPGVFHLVLLRNSVLTYNVEMIQRTVLERIRRNLLAPGLLVIGRTEKMPEGVGFDQISRCIYRAT